MHKTQINDHKEYNIGFVSKAVDLAVSTIKTWERRYRVIQEKRNTNDRLYYDDSDIEKLQLIKLLKENGASISSVAQLSNQDLRTRLAQFVPDSIEGHYPTRANNYAPYQTVIIKPCHIDLDQRFHILREYPWVDDCIQTEEEHANLDLILVTVEQVNRQLLDNIIKLNETYPVAKLIVCYRIIRHEYLDKLMAVGIFPIRLPLPDNLVTMYLEMAMESKAIQEHSTDSPIEHLFTKDEIEASIIDIMDKFVNKNIPGVCVQASTLGSLEALL